MTPRTWFVAFLLAVMGSACASVSPVPGVSDVYFTNAQSGPGAQSYNATSQYQILPPVTAFDRKRDGQVKIVIVFSTGNAHSLQAVLNTPQGATRPITWETPARTQFGTWATTSAYWSINPSTPPGRYTVDLTIDGMPAGIYSFELQ
jgi:hypothetical protein